MNKLQYLLLKLNEESLEIATALIELEDGAFSEGNNQIKKFKEVNLEINDLNAVIEKLKIDFDFDISIFQSFTHERIQYEHQAEGICFWLNYTIHKALAVSKIASKCIQFGLNETNPVLTVNNSTRLQIALRDLYFGVDCLNEYGKLGYEKDCDHIAQKLEKIEKYLQYSIELNCVSSTQPPKEQLPKNFQVFVDEYSNFPRIDKIKPQTVIELPHKP